MHIETEFKNLIQVIEEAGKLARAYFDADEFENEIKADGSVVTKIDKEIEQKLVRYIKEHFRDDTIIGEEGGVTEGVSGFIWHIDPIDGTDNFLRKIPFCAISVARLGDTPEDSLGIVHNPITGQTFASLMEGGVYENERVCQMNEEILGGRVVIGISRSKQPWMRSATYNIGKSIAEHFGKGTWYNCCALEIAYIAANRLDGVLILEQNSYDYAAGLYLVKASGGQISVWRDGAWQEWTDSLKELCKEHGETIFVSHAGIHQKVRDHIGDPRKWSDE